MRQVPQDAQALQELQVRWVLRGQLVGLARRALQGAWVLRDRLGLLVLLGGLDSLGSRVHRALKVILDRWVILGHRVILVRRRILARRGRRVVRGRRVLV